MLWFFHDRAFDIDPEKVDDISQPALQMNSNALNKSLVKVGKVLTFHSFALQTIKGAFMVLDSRKNMSDNSLVLVLKYTRAPSFIKGYYTTLQSVTNANLSQHRFWHYHENGLIKTIQMIAHNLYRGIFFNHTANFGAGRLGRGV